MDKTSAAGFNPLTEAIRSVLAIRSEGFSYNAVFRYLRSGMSGLTPDETDLLENYCLARGIRGRRKWALPFDAEAEPLRINIMGMFSGAPVIWLFTSITLIIAATQSIICKMSFPIVFDIVSSPYQCAFW